MKLSKQSLRNLLAYILAAFFFIGGVGNILNPVDIAADYARWGYPSWFHFVTGGLELVAAILIVVTRVRFWGSALGSVVMIGALATLLRHGEYSHAIAPLVVLTISIIVGWMSRMPSIQRAPVDTDPESMSR